MLVAGTSNCLLTDSVTMLVCKHKSLPVLALLSETFSLFRKSLVDLRLSSLLEAVLYRTRI